MRHVYLSLALNSLEKNRRLYVPYACAGAMMFAMFSIIAALTDDPYVNSIRGAHTLTMILSMGQPVIMVLSVIFIFYISSFVMKRRKKELGMYSVLGMEKSHVIRVVTIENSITAMAGMILGSLLTVALEKGVQYVLIKIMNASTDKGFSLPLAALGKAWGLFGVIYLLVILNCAREILFFSAINYMKEENAGEKKPKFNPVTGILGIVILAAAYVIAGTGTNSFTLILRFALAVLMVIIGTYMLFISGSVMILSLLKKNKNYYYKTSRFISVSGMIYRMKRHGAGLASICILSTMVLVMMSSVTTVYMCSRESADAIFPRDYFMRVEYPTGGETPDPDRPPVDTSEVAQKVIDIASSMGLTVDNMMEYSFVGTYFNLAGSDLQQQDYEYGALTYIISVDDYNEANGTSLELSHGQAGIFSNEMKIPETFSILNGVTYSRVDLEQAPRLMVSENIGSYSTLWIVLPTEEDVSAVWDLIDSSGEYIVAYSNENRLLQFDLNGAREAHAEFFVRCSDELFHNEFSQMELNYMNTCEGRIQTEDGEVFSHMFCKSLFLDFFYAVYGGIFFLGILLSIVCIVIAVLVIYFKQLLEGYEDAARFGIMKKVGLSDKEIKKSVYSQMVTVFFLPVAFAAVHTAFAYRMINNLMRTTFGYTNETMYFYVLLAVFFVFIVFYFVIFLITGRNYIKIVENSAS